MLQTCCVSCSDSRCVNEYIIYNLLPLTYKTLNGTAPEYHVNQLQDYCPTRALQSVDQHLMSMKNTRIKIGDILR